eukprot:IDg12014t1
MRRIKCEVQQLFVKRKLIEVFPIHLEPKLSVGLESTPDLSYGSIKTELEAAMNSILCRAPIMRQSKLCTYQLTMLYGATKRTTRTIFKEASFLMSSTCSTVLYCSGSAAIARFMGCNFLKYIRKEPQKTASDFYPSHAPPAHTIAAIAHKMVALPQTVLFQDLQVRPFVKADTSQVIKLIGDILAEYGFKIIVDVSEKDCMDVPKYYASGEFWVAHDASGNVVGTGAFRALRGTDSKVACVAELRRLYIARSYRRRGLGGMLLAAVEDRARAAGFTTMVLESASALREAAALYARE